MSKELEALKEIGEIYQHTEEGGYRLYEDDKIKNCVKEQFELLLKALTPPTALEVCKALRKYIEYGEVKYSNNEFCIFQDKKRYSISNYAYKNKYQIYAYLPPHLITLIGRFYESVVK